MLLILYGFSSFKSRASKEIANTSKTQLASAGIVKRKQFSVTGVFVAAARPLQQLHNDAHKLDPTTNSGRTSPPNLSKQTLGHATLRPSSSCR